MQSKQDRKVLIIKKQIRKHKGCLVSFLKRLRDGSAIFGAFQNGGKMALLPEEDEHGDNGQQGRQRVRDDVLKTKRHYLV